MTDGDFKAACEEAFETLRSLAPYDTGNLARNAIRLEFVSPKEALLYVSEAIAPYMPYTNEPWISPHWNGKKNPNEGWFDKAAEIIAQRISERLNGEVKNVDG